MISIVTASIMSLCPYCYSIYYVFTISIVTTSTKSQWSPLLQHLIRHNVLLYTIGRIALLTCYPINNHLSLITAHAWRYLSYQGNPLDAQAQERQAGRNAQAHVHDYVMFCNHIVFCVLPFLLSDIPGPRLISREDAHPMYLRYPRVFLFVMIYCPLPL